MARIGIYSGTFNPVHAGHISLALQALETGKLDKLYFLPERQSRIKKGVEHYGHRVAMLERALKPHPKLEVLDLPDANLSVVRTLARLELLHPDDQLVFLFGSDAVQTLALWPHSDRLLKKAELIIGIRTAGTEGAVRDLVATWPQQPKKLYCVESFAPDVSSTAVREAISRRATARGLLTSVARYSNHHWLYVSLAKAAQLK